MQSIHKVLEACIAKASNKVQRCIELVIPQVLFFRTVAATGNPPYRLLAEFADKLSASTALSKVDLANYSAEIHAGSEKLAAAASK